MLLAIDVGNTNITCGVFDGEEMMATFRITTKEPRTSDEYGFLINNMIEKNRIKPSALKAIIISSVVPKINYSIGSALIKYFGITPVIVGTDMDTGIRMGDYDARQVGADRIVDAAAAYSIYGGPVIVIDYGTATTFDLITSDGVFIGGVTAPGAQSAASTLWTATAQLPEVEIIKPDSVIAKDTVSSMQAGIYYTLIGQTEAIVRQLKAEADEEVKHVVATGGLGSLITEGTDVIDEYNPSLTMEGLRIIYEKQTG